MKRISIALPKNEVKDIFYSFINRYSDYKDKWSVKIEDIDSDTIKLMVIDDDTDITEGGRKSRIKSFYIRFEENDNTTMLYINYKYVSIEIFYAAVFTCLVCFCLCASIWLAVKNPQGKGIIIYLLIAILLSVFWLFKGLLTNKHDKKRLDIFNEILEENFPGYVVN